MARHPDRSALNARGSVRRASANYLAGLGTPRGQTSALLALVTLSVLIYVGSIVNYDLLPFTTFIIPILLGSLVLRVRQFLILLLVIVVCVIAIVSFQSLTPVRVSAIGVMAIYSAIALHGVSRRRTGLPAALGESILIDLSQRLQSNGVLPTLPPQWYGQSEMRSADHAQFAGDFVVASRTQQDRHLEIVMVDVSGKGLAAGTRALQLSGAFGGLLGAIEPEQFMPAAGAYLLRQEWDEGFATALHLDLDLESGRFVVRTAGHPPCLHWHAGSGRWEVHRSSGPALGIDAPPEFVARTGLLARGDAMLLYTDGMVETPNRDYEMGIDRLIGKADHMIGGSFEESAARLIDQLDSTHDDRAVVVLHRR